MDDSVIEINYPLSFRKEEAKKLGEHLLHRHSVDLVGMKRVGISNFLRFFLYHKDVVSTYISPEQKHLFIPVDLNDLIEREIYPFWSLTLKRILDVVDYSYLPGLDKKRIESLFIQSIQSQDLFILIDNVRKALKEITAVGVLPTLYLLRFDRIKDVITPQFFDNLQGLRDSTHQKLAYVFTSYQTLDRLSPNVFSKASLSVFAQVMYMKPARPEEMRVIYETYKERYKLQLSQELEDGLFHLTNGNVQYLQLALIILHEKSSPSLQTKDDLFSLINKDERITLQSEELWESLSKEEKEIVMKIARGEDITPEEKTKASYVWDTGMAQEMSGKQVLFSALFASYVSGHDEKGQSSNGEVHFSKKEHLLMQILEKHKDAICEREQIVESVWPEYKEFGVSDWAIDRLVARVRTKLKQQKSPYEILTIRTRGYKLIPVSQ